MARMNVTELEQLVRKYYGYVVDLEGSGVEVLDLLFVRDNIQVFLDQLSPDETLPSRLYAHIYELDALLWAERGTFLLVLGENELRHARQGQGSPRSHWWWYVDELQAPPEPVKEQHERLAQVFASAGE
jgi:hypothetical protein